MNNILLVSFPFSSGIVNVIQSLQLDDFWKKQISTSNIILPWRFLISLVSINKLMSKSGNEH